MQNPFPNSAQLDVSSRLADDLLKAANRLPRYDNKEYYSLELQKSIHDCVRSELSSDFDWLVQQIKIRLAKRPYCALVCGLSFDDDNRLFIAINRAFGDLVARPYERPRAQLVHYIQVKTDRKSSQGAQYETEKLHTDTADWENPVKFISMLCVRSDSGNGGRSLVMDIDTIRKQLKNKMGRQVVDLLSRNPVPWKKASYNGGGLVWRKVLSKSSVCWRRYTIDLDHSAMTEELLAALDTFEKSIISTPNTIDFLMKKNELLFLDNLRTLHARTPLSAEGSAERLMIRSWISDNEHRQKGPVEPGDAT